MNGQREDDLDLQRALEESLFEYNSNNNRAGSPRAECESRKQEKGDDEIQCMDRSVTFNDLMEYSRSVQNELVNILSFDSNKSKKDLESLNKVIRGEVAGACYEMHELYDCMDDPELRPLPSDQINDLINVVFGAYGSVLAQYDDIKRWINHTIEFSYDATPGIKNSIEYGVYGKADFLNGEKSIFASREAFSRMNYCLAQQGGGPCGVLASLNGLIISQLVFNPFKLEREKEKQVEDLFEYLNSVSQDKCWEALIQSICMVIFQSSRDSKYRVIQFKPRRAEILDHLTGQLDVRNDIYYYVDYEDIVDVYHFYYKRLKGGIFSKTGSLFSILLSVVGSRTPERVRSDMDDLMVPLVGMFGHCSQELVNLLITGSAVSNVFDGIKVLNDSGNCEGIESLSLKGINKRSILGYLTEHEALQYCKVGFNYKNPLYPIWIIVNKNHYKCSFTLNFMECILTVSQEFSQVVQKAFDKFDTESSGFIFENQLESFLDEISLGDFSTELRGLSENGIILWNDLKRSIFSLMGIEHEDNNRLRGIKLDESFSSKHHKLWTSVYIFDYQKRAGKKLIVSTIFSLENYSRVRGLYNEFSHQREEAMESNQNDGSKKRSTEELDLISILQTRWGEETVIETRVYGI
ncbi:UIM domain-containing and EF hand-containing protein [Cryptosporidium canis]|uniref:ubiquitinyl hydrolase 1 n=1 Tax=Cryptosporidium canis TaxID=195482 RepID=A0A9D5DK68_9CRYT|nr:UIM domain-containing and EF hand-containing protein [Cryptosporidium canis]